MFSRRIVLGVSGSLLAGSLLIPELRGTVTASDATHQALAGSSKPPVAEPTALVAGETLATESSPRASDFGEGEDATTPDDGQQDGLSLHREIENLLREAESTRDGAARLERLLRNDPALVARIIRQIAAGEFSEPNSRMAVVLAIQALPSPRFAAAKAALKRALAASQPKAPSLTAQEMKESLASADDAVVVRTLGSVETEAFRDGEIVRLLQSLIGDGHSTEVRRAALDALVRMCSAPPDVETARELERKLVDILKRPLPASLESAATRALSLCTGEQVATTLGLILSDSARSPEARRHATGGLGRQAASDETTPRLIAAYRFDHDQEVRCGALLSLGAHARVREDALSELLFVVQSDEDMNRRQAAVLALMGLSDPRVDAVLFAVSTADASPSVREVAKTALGSLRARRRA